MKKERVKDLENLIERCYQNDSYREVMVCRDIPGDFYTHPQEKYSEWLLIKPNSSALEKIAVDLKSFEAKYDVTVPSVLREFISCFWKEELTIESEDVQYWLFKTLPGKELDEFKKAMKAYIEFGTFESGIPFAVDEFGNWILISNKDGSIWVEDTDLEENIEISKSLLDFLCQKTTRF